MFCRCGSQGASQNRVFSKTDFQQPSQNAMLADSWLAESMPKLDAWRMCFPKRRDVFVHGCAQHGHDSTPRQLTGRRTKSNTRKAIIHTANVEWYKPPQTRVFCTCCLQSTLQNAMFSKSGLQIHRKTRCLADSPTAFGKCGLQNALRATTLLRARRQSTTASHCSYTCFAQASQRLAQAGPPSPGGQADQQKREKSEPAEARGSTGSHHPW